MREAPPHGHAGTTRGSGNKPRLMRAARSGGGNSIARGAGEGRE